MQQMGRSLGVATLQRQSRCPVPEDSNRNADKHHFVSQCPSTLSFVQKTPSKNAAIGRSPPLFFMRSMEGCASCMASELETWEKKPRQEEGSVLPVRAPAIAANGSSFREVDSKRWKGITSSAVGSLEVGTEGNLRCQKQVWWACGRCCRLSS